MVDDSVRVTDGAFIVPSKDEKNPFSNLKSDVPPPLDLSIVVNGGELNIGSGKADGNVATDVTVNDAGRVNVSDGGTVINGTINRNGSIADYAGGTSSEIVVNGGRVDIYSGGLNLGGTVQDGIAGGTFNVWKDGINSGATATDSARIYVAEGGTDKGVILQSGGHAYVDKGGIDSDATVMGGGWDEIGGGGSVHGGTIMSGGTMNVNAGGTIIGQVDVMSGATVTLFPDAGGTLNLESDDNKAVTVNGVDTGGGTVEIKTVFSNFNGDDSWNGSEWIGPTDGIHLAGVQGSDVTSITFANDGKDVPYPDKDGQPSDEAIIHLKNGGEIILHIPDAAKIGGHIVINPDGSITYEANGCFLTGTHILTPEGYKKIESLCVGDEVITIDPKSGQKIPQKLVWTGMQWASVNLRSDTELGDDERGWSVCIKKGAFDPLLKAGMIPAFVQTFSESASPKQSLPIQDLYVTSEHCFLFRDLKTGENKFLPIRMLVNGKDIYYDYTSPSYLYCHIETEKHSIILSEGVLSESYLDTGDRKDFQHLLVLPDKDGGISLGMGIQQGFSNKTLSEAEISYRQKAGWQRAVAKLDTSRPFAEMLWNCLTRREVNFFSSFHKDSTPFCQHNTLLEEVYLSCGERRFSPYQWRGKQLLFMLPLELFHAAAELDPEEKAQKPKFYLCAPAARPCDVEGPFVDDRRRLGLLVGRLHIAPFEEPLMFHLSAEALTGWNNVEPAPMRWTTEKALLPFHKEKEKISNFFLRKEIFWSQKIVLAVEVVDSMCAKNKATLSAMNLTSHDNLINLGE